MTDPRLIDPRVKAAQHAAWIADDQWDGNSLRPGFTEHLAPYMDGLDETVNPPHPPVPANSVPVQGVPHSMFEPMRRMYWVLIVTPVVGVLVVVFLAGRWLA